MVGRRSQHQFDIHRDCESRKSFWFRDRRQNFPSSFIASTVDNGIVKFTKRPELIAAVNVKPQNDFRCRFISSRHLSEFSEEHVAFCFPAEALYVISFRSTQRDTSWAFHVRLVRIFVTYFRIFSVTLCDQINSFQFHLNEISQFKISYVK